MIRGAQRRPRPARTTGGHRGTGGGAPRATKIWHRSGTGTKASPAGRASGRRPDIAVIGGGAAGFMAAVSAAEAGAGRLSVTVFERGEPMAKLLLTGHGRCNLTNATFDPPQLAAHYPRGERFLLSAFSRFGARETMGWFEARGLRLRVEDDRRVFPASNDAATVRDLLLDRAGKLGIEVRTGTAVREIRRQGDGFLLLTGTAVAGARRVILATGGDVRRAAPSGYDLAEALGHRVTPLGSSLTSLRARESWIPGLAGVAVRDVAATAFLGGRKIALARGGILFTHRGISGPLAFHLSSLAAGLDIGPRSPLLLELNLAPELGDEGPEKALLRETASRPARKVANLLGTWMPRSLASALLGDAGIDPEKAAARLTREERRTLVRLLTRAAITVTGRAAGEEMVTAGGVALDDVDQKTMASRKAPGLYVCGELLDIDGLTGGFNLQAAWTTGYLAGTCAARSLGALSAAGDVRMSARVRHSPRPSSPGCPRVSSHRRSS